MSKYVKFKTHLHTYSGSLYISEESGPFSLVINRIDNKRLYPKALIIVKTESGQWVSMRHMRDDDVRVRFREHATNPQHTYELTARSKSEALIATLAGREFEFKKD